MLKPYESYKETNIPWLSEVPSQWDTKRNSAIFYEVIDANHPELDLLSITTSGVVKQSTTGRKIRMSADNSSYKKIQIGDIGYNLMNAFIGSIGVSKYDGIISPAYAVCRFRNIELHNPKYYHYLFRTKELMQEFDNQSYGIMVERNRLYFERFKTIINIVPSLVEQDQIVKYLDWQTSKINTLIVAKKKQIELLKEKIFTQTTVAAKSYESSLKLKRIVSYPRNWIERDSEKVYSPIGVLNRGRGVFEKDKVEGKSLGNSDFFEIEKDCLILSGQFAWEGSVALTTMQHIGCIASHRYYTVKGLDKYCLTEYLWAYFRTQNGDLLLNKCSHGAAGRNKPLNFNELMNEYIPLPSIKEQEQIKNDVRLLFKIVEEEKRFEVVLNEYKASLISSVVTGKVDVRGVDVPDVAVVEEVVECDEDEEVEKHGD